jgi:hypothetical protein
MQAQAFMVPANAKKKSKTEKKLAEMKKMLQHSDKFYKEVCSPEIGDIHTIDAILVLREDLQLCSVDSTMKEYKSWPHYCQTHKFISSLSGSLPDMILPKDFENFESITD